MSVKIPGYEMLRPIAEGGMASVYLAVQESLGRYVAIKLLKRFDNPDQARRFQNEGRIIASLNHRNIITIHDIGVHEDRHYISMEYLEGGDLEERIQAGMSAEAALDLLEVMGGCLDFLHCKAIIHRDMKPANILFHKDGTPILTDFGVARQLEADMRLTMEGSAVGSPYYLSPEQAECKPLDGRTDIYSLGIIFHEMLTGVKPFQGDSHIETILAHLTEPVPSLPPVLKRYQSLLDRMIAKDPAERFATAGEMLGYIHQLRQCGPGVCTASGGFTDLRGISHFGVLARAQQPLHKLIKTSRDMISKIMALVPRRTRNRWITAGALTAFIATSGLLMYQPSILTEETVSDTDSLALTVSLGPLSLDERAAHEMNTQPGNKPLTAVMMGHAEDRLSREEGMETDVNKETGYTFTVQDSDAPARPREELLLLAQHALDEYRLTTPMGDNAYYYYHSILENEPGNEEALAGVRQVAGIYASLAEKEIDRFHYNKARTYIERGLAIDPNNAQLRTLESSNTFSGMSQRAFGKVKSLFQ